ncbi:MAG: hypothetical protein JNL97_00540 [Verrucomicrobiales bacterium]|nr:hypothetical protein [Verrucomicrobiales bacterium]
MTRIDHARVLVQQGRIEEGLGILEGERTRIVGERNRAVLLGDIARIRAAKGEVDEALKLHQERIGIFEGLGDVGEKAHTLWAIAQIEIAREQWQAAFDHLAESYGILQRLGRLDGICVVGWDLGRLLCMAGQKEQGIGVLMRSRDGFVRLGQVPMAKQVEEWIRRMGGADGLPSA